MKSKVSDCYDGSTATSYCCSFLFWEVEVKVAECRCSEKTICENDIHRLEYMIERIDSSYEYIESVEDNVDLIAENELSAYEAHNVMTIIDCIRRVDNGIRDSWDAIREKLVSAKEEIEKKYSDYCDEDENYHKEQSVMSTVEG